MKEGMTLEQRVEHLEKVVVQLAELIIVKLLPMVSPKMAKEVTNLLKYINDQVEKERE